MSKHLVATVANMGALEASIGVQKPDFFTEILRKSVRMCEQCVPGRLVRYGNESSTACRGL